MSRNCGRVGHHCTDKPSGCLVRLGDPGFEVGHDKNPTLSVAHGHCHLFIPNRTLDFRQRAHVDQLRTFRIDGVGLGDISQSEERSFPVLRLGREVESNEWLGRGRLGSIVVPTEKGYAPFMLWSIRGSPGLRWSTGCFLGWSRCYDHPKMFPICLTRNTNTNPAFSTASHEC